MNEPNGRLPRSEYRQLIFVRTRVYRFHFLSCWMSAFISFGISASGEYDFPVSSVNVSRAACNASRLSIGRSSSSDLANLKLRLIEEMKTGLPSPYKGSQ